MSKKKTFTLNYLNEAPYQIGDILKSPIQDGLGLTHLFPNEAVVIEKEHQFDKLKVITTYKAKLENKFNRTKNG